MKRLFVISMLLALLLLNIGCKKQYQNHTNQIKNNEPTDKISDDLKNNNQPDSLIRKYSNSNTVIIITDVLNVRNTPSIDGRIIQQKKFGDVFQIYKEQGSGNLDLENHVVDYWYKISQDKEEWVNAFYVRKFPFYFAGDDYVPFIVNDGVETFTSPVTVKVKDAYEENEIWYLNMEVLINYPGIGYSFIRSITEKILETYIFEYEELKLRNEPPIELKLLDNQFNHVIELFNDIEKKRESSIKSEYYPGLTKYSDSVYYKKYDFSEIELKYGIGLGKPINYVTEVLGHFYFIQSNWTNAIVYSQLGYWDYGYDCFRIYFFTDNGKICEITLEYPHLK